MNIKSKMINLLVNASTMLSFRKQQKLPPITDRYLLMPATKLSKLIKDGTITSSKLCEKFIDRIKQVQPMLNAMAEDRFEEAKKDANRVDELLAQIRSGKSDSDLTSEEQEMLRSPLLGVPITVKESIQIKNMKNSCGLWVRRNEIAEDDAVTVKNAKRAGMIVVCSSNIPEATLYWADCQNPVYGLTVNPYDQTRITGASSGGEGALIGSGASVVGLGSDIACSLRCPASYCGICSHKPSPFLVSPEGNYPTVVESRLRLFTIGPMARYASDLRPLLKVIISDKDNDKQDSYANYQPKDISSLRKNVIQQLDDPRVDISKCKFYYFNPDQSKLSGKHSIKVLPDYLQAQEEILNHFSSKFNCQIEPIDMDNYLKLALICCNNMLRCGGTAERDKTFIENELLKIFGIQNSIIEMLKLPFGLSTHTKEALLSLTVVTVPEERPKAYEYGERFEKIAAELKAEMEHKLGDNGLILMPTMPTVAYKINGALLKSRDVRFPAIFNVLQLPVTHITLGLDKQNNMPFGVSIAGKPYHDCMTLCVGEEIEQLMGGWIAPVQLDTQVAGADVVKTAPNNMATKITPTTIK